MDAKICKICKEPKQLDNFHKNKNSKDGKDARCKSCRHQQAIDNREKKKEYDLKRYNENKPLVQEWSRQYYINNKAHKIQKTNEWQKKNKDKVGIYKKNNKYKRRLIVKSSNLTGSDLKLWLDSQIKICSYCGCDCRKGYQIDHVEPISNDGTHEIDNLTISCKKCNNSKSDRSLILWLAIKTTIRS